MDRRKDSGTATSFARDAVERMRGGNNIVRLARELGVCRRVLYNWRDQIGREQHSTYTNARTDVAQTDPQT